MFEYFRIAIFMISSLGYWEYLRRETNISIYFHPFITIACQVSILFVAGLLNCLNEAALFIYFGGLGLVFYHIYLDRNVKFFKKYINPGYVYLVIWLVIFVVLLENKLFTHYDNFSHWAIVLKPMLYEHRFPNFKDSIITFTRYPLGSSIWIYYFTIFVKQVEWIEMFSQGYMIIASILPVFMYLRKNKILSFMSVMIFTNIILVYNIWINDLLVDTLLPVVGMAMLLYVYKYFDYASIYNILIFIPMGVWVLQIKNSGILFVLLAIAYVIVKHRKMFDDKIESLMLFAPFFSMVLWHKHCDYVFSNSKYGRHAMTMSNYMKVFGQKNEEEIYSIGKSYIASVLKNDNLIEIVIFMLVIGLISLCLYGVCKSYIKKGMLFAVGLMVIYLVSLYGMYIFSMPSGEAKTLASLNRYLDTVLISVLYIMTVVCIKLLSEIDFCGIKNRSCIIFAFSSILCLWQATGNFNNVFYTHFKEQSNALTRIWISNIKLKHNIPVGKSYCIIHNDSVNASEDYLYYIGKYEFETKNVSVIVPKYYTDSKSLERRLSSIKQQYIIIRGMDNDVVNKWIKKNFPEKCGNEAIVIRRSK